jgi:NAD-dependent dihydropyrimidine dehydrogenase PreA subunit
MSQGAMVDDLADYLGRYTRACSRACPVKQGEGVELVNREHSSAVVEHKDECHS